MTTDPRRAEAEKIANDHALQTAAKFWNEMILKHFRQREDRPGYEIDWNEIGEALAKALLAAEERGAKAERAAWTECTKDLGPLLAKAKADGVLDTLIEANIWPLPATCITDADIRHATEVAIAIRPDIEAEQCSRGLWQPIDTAPKDREILISTNTYASAGFWHDGSDTWRKDAGWYWESDRSDMYNAKVAFGITHWRPLPDAPSPQEGE